MYKKSKKKRIITAIIVLIVLAAMVVTMVLSAFVSYAQTAGYDHKTIPNGIYIGEISLGGMTQQEAENAVSEYVDSLADEKVILSANGKSLEASVHELGLEEDVQASVEDAINYGMTGNLVDRYKARKDLEQEDIILPMSMTVNEEQVREFLENHVEEVNQEAVDFGLKRENGGFTVIGGEDGVEVDIDTSVEEIAEYFAAGWTGEAQIDLAVGITKPQGSEEELRKVKDVLGKFTTNYSSSASGRKKNVSNGCSKINGSLLYPGEVFSVYEAVNPFTAENGYALAGSYENGTTVETYGGGICQVSTTLYNAVIRAELEVVERSGHSMIVGYVDPSADAAIAGTYKDFKFKNNTDAPIYIEGYSDGANLSFTVYGVETRPANRKVSFISETTSVTNPTVEYRAGGAAIGSMSKVQSSHTGKTAQLWKVVTVDGVEQSRDLFNKTTYKMSPTIYEVGTASSNSQATAAMKAAIASQNEGAIKAAMAKWNASALQAAQQQQQQEQQQQQQQQQEQSNQGQQEAPAQ